MKLKCLSMIAILFVSVMASAKTYEYAQGEQKFAGDFLPAQKAKAPAVLVIHNWMGVTTETLKQAERFHKLGYNVFVADIYGKGVRPTSVKEAGELATKYKTDRKLFRERIELAYKEMLKQKSVDATKTAILGYCFGGTGALEAARSNSQIKGAISFHGGLDSLNPQEGANIKAQVLALHGADDPYVAEKDLNAFEKEMRDHKVQFELIKFGNAVHSFTEQAAGNDNSKGAAYNQLADIKSFAYSKHFLETVFK